MGETGQNSPALTLVQLAIGASSVVFALIGTIHIGVALMMLLPGTLGLLVKQSRFLRISALLANGLNIAFWCYAMVASMADRAVNQDALVCFIPFAFGWILLCMVAGVRTALLNSDAQREDADW